MKKGSADGRLLIWKVSSQLIKEKPIFGYGIEKFQAHYMEKQANYFSGNPESKEAFVADNIIYPFNEFIKTLAELGIAGMIFIVLLIIVIFRFREKQKSFNNNSILTAVKAGIFSFLVFSFFSYPLEILPISVNLIILLAINSEGMNFQKMNVPLKLNLSGNRLKLIRFIPALTASIVLIISFAPIKYLYSAYYYWDEGYKIYQMGAYKESLDSFEKSYPELRNNGEFLIMYGKALSMAGKDESAKHILEKAKQYQQNTILFNALGDSYKNLKQYRNAEESYLQAYFMIPSRFYSKYLLVKMYAETGQIQKAKKHAREILEKEVKVPSRAIEEIQAEMRAVLK